MNCRLFPAVVLAIAYTLTAHADFLGMDLGPLLQLVGGQIQEIERLSEQIGLAKDQAQLLRDLNDGINRTVDQINSIQSIIERAQNLDPRSVRSLAELNDLISRAQDVKYRIDEILAFKIGFANQAISAGALQSDTANRMGQEMAVFGSRLSRESANASPGRSSQLTASAESAQVMARGVELQTLAQLVQLQSLSLEFQKSQVERDLEGERLRRQAYQAQLGAGATRKAKR